MADGQQLGQAFLTTGPLFRPPPLAFCGMAAVVATPLLCQSDGEKVTLGSFLFRDDCYTLLTRLVNVSSSISRLNGFSPSPLTGELWRASPDRGSFDVDDEPQHEDTPPEPPESSPGVAIPGALAASSRPSNGNFETMVDVVLPCTVAQVCCLSP